MICFPLNLRYRLFDGFGYGGRQKKGYDDREGHKHAAKDQVTIPNILGNGHKLPFLLGDSDTPLLNFYRGKSGNFVIRLKDIIQNTGFSCKHGPGNFFHAGNGFSIKG